MVVNPVGRFKYPRILSVFMNRSLRRLLLHSFICSFLLGVTSAAEEQPTPDQILPFKVIDGITLNLHVFKPAGHDAGDRRPAIVFFFGGGWRSGSPAQFYSQSAYLAARGMVAIAAEYRVESRHGTDPRACVRDGKSAMRWVRGHARELGIDPKRLAAGGGSAGGHVAAAAAFLEEFNEDSDDLNVSCRPDALVLFNPVFDNGPDGYGFERVEPYWKSISPLHHLTSDAPPTLVLLGTADKLIPVATAERYRDRMIALGARCDLRLYEGREHGFFNASRGPEDHQATLIAMEEFLVSLAYVPEP